MGQREIVIQGAREHNLKGVDLRLPRGALITMTGVSGSGKSSLAFDTIYQEGQRRFVESLSSYARQFLGQTEKPKVEHIEGLSPTISIDQKTVNRSPRSTVGTVTEIYDHLRLLFSRLGVPHCPTCGKPVSAQSAEQIVERILETFAGRPLVIVAPVVKDRKGEYRKELEALRMKGYARARIDGAIRRLDEPITLARYERHTIEVVLDRIEIGPSKRARVAEAVQQGLKLGEGTLSVLDGEALTTFSSTLACPGCGTSLPEMEPRTFSFNSPHGACPECDGLGLGESVDPKLVVPFPEKTIDEGAIAPMSGASFSLRHHMGRDVMEQVCEHFGIPRDVPWKDLPARARTIILEGSDETLTIARSFEGKRMRVKTRERKRWPGVIPAIQKAHDRLKRNATAMYMSPSACPACGGSRLRRDALAVRFRDRTIADLGGMTVTALHELLRGIEFPEREQPIGDPIRRELVSRLRFLEDVGLGYLSVDRGTGSLSGGESQRIRLATQVGSNLRGILYVLDEPSIGLHQRDNRRLIETLERLRDSGNTVIVVEHDRETMQASDFLVDVGPGAGRDGGEIVATGTIADLIAEPRSITGAFLSGRERIEPPPERRKPSGRWVGVRGARAHNLKNLDVDFPLGSLVVVTGVSGSGKSTLVNDILKRALAQRLHGAQDRPGAHDAIVGIENLDKVIEIDQSPIGRTPRSNPATYTGVFDEIRELFANLPEAKARGYQRGRFSFNVKGGRCESCGGAGVKLVEMQFLSDVEVPCDVCSGRRFNPETLEIQYRFKSINDVLSMTISEALAFFENHKKIRRGLEMLEKIGLGYVQLGQPSTTLSGGEAQRVKLASQLQRPPTGRTLYVLDEPTTGLHFIDVRRLVSALQALVDAGNTVVVIEHNLEVVRCADWILDLGPGGGVAGGEIIWAGPYDGILAHPASPTAQMLREMDAPLPPRGPRHEVADLSLSGDVVLKGARLNNLKNVEARFPAGKLTVVTGPSGSGKTSLVFDTLFAEGQRRFVECLSTYARQFLGRLDRPPLDALEGLAPSIAIDQKNASRNPRSTVATITETHDYLRLLFARVGIPHCPVCGKEAAGFAPDQVVKDMVVRFPDAKGRILAPLYLKGFPKALRLAKPEDLPALVEELKTEGFQRLMIGGEEVRLDELSGRPKATKVKEIFLVVDRVQISEKARTRLLDSVAQGYAAAHGIVAFETVEGARTWYGEHPSCVGCGFFLDEALSPRMFSFNSHVGACEACHGLGSRLKCDPEKLIADPDRPLFDGALIDKPGDFLCRSDGYFRHVIEKLAVELGFDLRKPWKNLRAEVRKMIMNGLDRRVDLKFETNTAAKKGTWQIAVAWKGFCHYIEDWFTTSDNEEWVEILSKVMRADLCADCKGERLKPAFRAVKLAGTTLHAIGQLTVRRATEFFAGVRLEKSAATIAEQPLREVRNRLGFLDKVGLGYLELGRAANTLSGGEAQRIRLATQIGNRLTGVIYVLDEPTIGLHQRDNERLLETLRDLRDLGNTIVVVEHDRETIETSDWVLDLGPGAGAKGGEVVFQGTAEQLARESPSLTGRYLREELAVPIPKERRAGDGRRLVLEDVTAHNLKHVEAAIPVGTLTSITGVSGSGKSSLVMDTLAPAMALATSRRRVRIAGLGRMTGAEAFDQCIMVDQAPIGSSPKSNPASYIKIFDEIREIFSTAPLAVQRGYGPGRFSYNVGSGRCGTCDGRGSLKIEMHFLPDVWITCESCRGRRYNRETLDVEYQGKTIADVLAMEITDAKVFFVNHRRIASALKLLEDVGLGYLELGRAATTLSGGEAQRIKLARELSKRSHGRTLYLLDEPTTGLHFDDVAKLVSVVQRLVDAGNTVVVIEHNLDVIAASDHVIDLGPEGGEEGGRIIAQGTPEQVARTKGSHTGRFLSKIVGSRKAARKAVAHMEAK